MKSSEIHQVISQVKASYSAIASEFNETRKQQWAEFEHFLKYVKPHSSVLDLGCGNGRLFEILKEKKVEYLGIDHNPELLKKAKQNSPETRFELGEMSNLKLGKNSFENIFCIAAFHHLPIKKLREKVVSDLHKALKKDGILILTTWNLLQKKYWREWMKAFFRTIFTFGLKGTWNDLWIKWGNYPLKRYYHSFSPSELHSLFNEKQWKIEELYFTKKGKRVGFRDAFNIVLIVRKIDGE